MWATQLPPTQGPTGLPDSPAPSAFSASDLSHLLLSDILSLRVASKHPHVVRDTPV